MSDKGAQRRAPTVPMEPVGIVIPTHWEACVILQRFGFKRRGLSLYTSIISGRPVFLCISGVGKAAARCAAERLVAEGARVLVSMGFCGALVPELKVGDLVTDRLVTSDTPARSAEERRGLTTRANAVAVDMETQAVVEVGTRRGVPIRVLRVVSDEAGDDLRPLLGSTGSISARWIALRILNPMSWPLAYRLFRNSRVARTRLADALERFTQER
jgi:adenosylhomocysteine nucleosidase